MRRQPFTILIATMAIVTAGVFVALVMGLERDLRWLTENAGAQDPRQLTDAVFGNVPALTAMRLIVAAVLLAAGVVNLARRRLGGVLTATGGIAGMLCVLLTYVILGKSQGTVDHYATLFFDDTQRILSYVGLAAAACTAVLGVLATVEFGRLGTRVRRGGVG